MKITGKTKLLGIIGYPLEHSLSPVFQNQALRALGLDYVYVPFPVKQENLKEVFQAFKAIGVRGFNVTIPHKEAVLSYLDHVSDKARLIGAVNTVWLEKDGWHGTNTDIDGFIYPLLEIKRDWSHITPLILGNGGAARAAVVGCAQLGCEKITIVGRNPEKLTKFGLSWHNTPLQSRISLHGWEEIPTLIPHSQLIVNTTPIGMYPHCQQSPLPPQAIESLSPETIVYDLIYNPRPTLLLRQAAARGLTTIDGSDMLVKQGAVALEIWVRQKAPLSLMRQSLLEALDIKTE